MALRSYAMAIAIFIKYNISYCLSYYVNWSLDVFAMGNRTMVRFFFILLPSICQSLVPLFHGTFSITNSNSLLKKKS
ncbi:hypothetical protein Q649_00957 [Bartonella quintana JK 73]|uniref:Uncharacterized protein n=1 Tax=Bartonella quintana JK 73 TaxID=1402976 RepID=W3TXH7_BARQI|nr:hypothetical protein Q650_00948 [Bartonella quintana JK 73rel]ETS16002.1 hypothetical protein Q649_00957 [Bartonella quintana JK 73]KEC60178.1 hypothetical protein O93_00315 [Bartonella quintana JK 19]KEC67987.1 hypothetical protein O7Q_00992 [Bartonella quintana JK 39]